MTHVHDWRLRGKPQFAARAPKGSRGGRVRGWTCFYRCAGCRAEKREPLGALGQAAFSGDRR